MIPEYFNCEIVSAASALSSSPTENTASAIPSHANTETLNPAIWPRLTAEEISGSNVVVLCATAVGEPINTTGE
ncbi:unannotated protein [freshwater metagenome]|uniref:Unannotated protein n=1 Tax=freshwater metagenome TaxID=449393 RepID=A0A6J6ITN8_9ZZZZ